MQYDGTEYAGFQYQKDLRSVQGEIEKALDTLTRSSVRVHGAGRTDAGVHALGQVVSFEAETRIPIDKLTAAMNSALPTDIRAVAAEEVDAGFHARFSARARSYVYTVLNRVYPSALLNRFTLHLPDALDTYAMADGAGRLVGEHDFRAWANGTAEVRSTVRSVMRCEVKRRGPFVLVVVEADGFLHSMVRNIVGTLIEVGLGRRTSEDIGRVTASGERAKAGPTAPAGGLCLLRVRY